MRRLIAPFKPQAVLFVFGALVAQTGGVPGWIQDLMFAIVLAFAIFTAALVILSVAAFFLLAVMRHRDVDKSSSRYRAVLFACLVSVVLWALYLIVISVIALFFYSAL